MTAFPKHNARTLIVAAAAAIAFVAGCADRSSLSGGRSACYEEGTWANDWCQYSAQAVPQHGDLEGHPISIFLPMPEEGGCAACDGRVLEEMMEEMVEFWCPGGDVEYEPGCATVWDGVPGAEPKCQYHGFVWGETCT